MMQRWSADTIRFMEDASRYGSYHRDLARALLPYLPTEGHVCDAGCGLGHLSLELAAHCRKVTAIDVSASALQGIVNRALPDNLRVLQGDVFSMEGHYDAMVFCYFGRTEEILKLAEKGTADRFLVVRRDCSRHQFSAGPVERKEHSINVLTRELEDRGISYVSKNLALELGQPFRSREDALAFFRLYNKSERP
ncbi:MAG: methyltransferase domain-containing protein, partial [Oscillospiraceae bacterium]|nr:methyltransferase domain-containing protein [Oscillospiraceae bacterium]